MSSNAGTKGCCVALGHPVRGVAERGSVQSHTCDDEDAMAQEGRGAQQRVPVKGHESNPVR